MNKKLIAACAALVLPIAACDDDNDGDIDVTVPDIGVTETDVDVPDIDVTETDVDVTVPDIDITTETTGDDMTTSAP